MGTWLKSTLFERKAIVVPGTEQHEDLLKDFQDMISAKHPEKSESDKKTELENYARNLAKAAHPSRLSILALMRDGVEKFFLKELSPYFDERGSSGFGDLVYSQGHMDVAPSAFIRKVERDARFTDAKLKEILERYADLEQSIGLKAEEIIDANFGSLMESHPKLGQIFDRILRYRYTRREPGEPEVLPGKEEVTTLGPVTTKPIMDTSAALSALIDFLISMEVFVGQKIEPEISELYQVAFPFDEKIPSLFAADPLIDTEAFQKTDIGYVRYFTDEETAKDFLSSLSPELYELALIDPDTEQKVVPVHFKPSYTHLPKEERESYETYTPAKPGSEPIRIKPPYIKGEKPREYTRVEYSLTDIRDAFTELFQWREQEEVFKQMGQELREKVWQALYADGSLEPEDIAKIQEEMPEVRAILEKKSEPQQSVSASLPIRKKKAVYDIVLGDEIIDSKYGKGSITGITNLDEGVVEVTFGPSVKVANYPADRIASPCMVDSEIVEFNCPMDMSVITAEACLGDMPSSPCSFLKFIEDKPHCTYIEEMKKMKDSSAKKKSDSGIQATMDQDKKDKIKAYLQELTKEATFTDHRAWLAVETFAPIRLYSMVIKKGTTHLGELIERNDDHSVIVQWESGEQTINWENELNAIQRKADYLTILDNPNWQAIPAEQLRNIYESASRLGRTSIGFGLRRERVVSMDEIHQFLKEQGAFAPVKTEAPVLE
jgi:hypothetical protein